MDSHVFPFSFASCGFIKLIKTHTERNPPSRMLIEFSLIYTILFLVIGIGCQFWLIFESKVLYSSKNSFSDESVGLPWSEPYDGVEINIAVAIMIMKILFI